MLNWILGICAGILWVTPVAWYFSTDIKRAWRERNDKWFRGDH